MIETSRRGLLAGLLALPLVSLVPSRFFPAQAHMAFVKGELPFVEIPGLSTEKMKKHRDLATQAIARKAMDLREVADLSRATVKAGIRDRAWFMSEHGASQELNAVEFDGVEYVWMRTSLWLGATKSRPHGTTEYHFLTRTFITGEDKLRQQWGDKADVPPLDRAQVRMANGLIPLAAVI